MNAETHLLVLSCGSSSVNLALFSASKVTRQRSSGAIVRNTFRQVLAPFEIQDA
jgi:hypothetical protein